MYKIISWNVNSIRKRLDHLNLLIEKEKPDFIFLQETRVVNEDFPVFNNYFSYIDGEKGRNGVAILSLYPLEVIATLSSRYINCCFKNTNLINIYVPNGGSISASIEHKIDFYNFLVQEVEKSDSCIVAGDMNVVYNPNERTIEDIYNLEEKNILKYFESFMDFYPSKSEYLTWWDYRMNSFKRNMGMGLDKFYFKGIDKVQTKILKEWRNLENCSDHCPIMINININ